MGSDWKINKLVKNDKNQTKAMVDSHLAKAIYFIRKTDNLTSWVQQWILKSCYLL